MKIPAGWIQLRAPKGRPRLLLRADRIVAVFDSENDAPVEFLLHETQGKGMPVAETYDYIVGEIARCARVSRAERR